MPTGWRARLRAYLAGVAMLPLLAVGTASAQSLSESPPPPEFSTTDRPLSEALMEFASETGADILYDPALVADIRVSSVSPDGSLEERLAGLLAGTSLTFSRLSSGTLVLVPRPVERTVAARILGRVVDASDGAGIAFAHVILSGTGRATATNQEGYFSFAEVEPGDHRLLATHVGFGVGVDSVRVVSGGTARINLSLSAVDVAISPIVVEDVQGLEAVHAQDRLSFTRRLESAPAGLAPDVVRSLSHLMGVRVGDEMADVHVQGGEAGEHQFRLDGVPVFEPVHLRGLLGAFNPFAIGRVTVRKAGFGAEYGSHLSGVISAEHALSSPDGHTFDVQIDPLSINARVQGAFDVGKSARARVMTAGRTSLWSLYPEQLYPPLKNLLREWNTPDAFLPQAWFYAVEQVDPELAQWVAGSMDSLDYTNASVSDPQLGFGDFHLAGDLRIGGRHILYGSLYRGWNRLNGNRLSIPLASPEVETPAGGRTATDDGTTRTTAHRDDYSWVNATAQIEYNALLSRRSLFRMRLRSSEYSLEHAYNALEQGSLLIFPTPGAIIPVRIVEDVRPTDNGNGIHEAALETGFHFDASRALAVSAGAEAVKTRYRFAIEDVSDYRPLSDSSSTWRFAAYGQGRARLGNRIQVTAGLRTTLLPERDALYLEPRAEARYAAPYSPAGPWSAWLATGLYRQFVNQFNVSSVSPSVLLPSIRFWLPTDATVSPPKAYHVAAGASVGPNRGVTVRGEVYYKHQPHLLFIDYIALWDQRRDGEGHLDAGQSRFLNSGRGYGYGGALGLERETVRTHALMLYEFSIARRSRTLLATEQPDLAGPITEPVRAQGFEPVPWNEPHRVEAAFDWRINSRLTVTARWRSYWGRAWAFRQSYYDYLATDPLLSPSYSYGSSGYDLRKPEDHRLPPFHQLDLAGAYSLPVGPTVLQFRVDLLNALNRKNEADWTLQPDERPDGEHDYRVVARTMLPRTPSITLRLRW